MPFYCYILECADGSYYTGWSVNPQKRLKVHNTGNGARYTRMHRPTKLVYVEEMPDRSSALKRELVIKHMDHAHKSKLIELASATLEEAPVTVT
jgi:putative endonuclease